MSSQQDFENLLQALPQGVLVHRHWQPLFVNRAYAELLGHSAEAVLAMPDVAFLFTEKIRSRIDQQLQQDHDGGDISIEQEYETLGKNEVSVSLYSVSKAIDWHGKPAWLTTIQDISAQKQAEMSWQAKAERFQTITENCPFGVAVSALSSSSVLYCNPRFAQSLGYSVTELSGKFITDLFFDPHDRELLLTLLQDEGQIHNYELQLRRKNGAAQWALLSLHKMTISGEQVLLSAIIDVSAMKQAQVELAQAAKLSTLGEIAAAIAHELNQPLSIISTVADLGLMALEAGDVDIKSLEDKLSTITQQAVRMVEITEHMRLFSRREPAELAMFDPRDCVSGAVRLMTNQLQAFGIELERELPIHCQSVVGRPLQVEQVVLNLLSNARDAVLERARRSRVKEEDYIPNIQVMLLDDKVSGRVRIVVQDNGYGVAEDIREQIFEPFFTTKPAGEGTGLGLSVSYRLIAEIGGELALTNSPEGARFEISLPGTIGVPAGTGRVPMAGRVEPPQKAANATLSNSSEGINSSEGFSRILVVDDEALLVQALADFLQQHGYETVVAGNGLEALNIYQTEPIDVVITDLWMPVMSGNELITRLRELNPSLPIIAVTGHAPLRGEEERAGEGASLILKKPIRLQAIKEALISLQNRLKG